ncbi:transglycosylase SLT domain protein [Acinetobacter baumannii OIFC0162]|uniref:transglycosylase SLT domain-containing protein n=1 Tax=Acinetobacter TaxID=469 RepID=UPI00028EE46B|nr:MULTISPECIES: transglycosylase SLT domain-containing protein [Acinetobacter calcoaceticus/baumannii complex]EKK06384.1 transglycosylase SLT domain protein [Acinetobacter baumannii OIFC0162]EXH86349.1 transglycosylase SLT domain protein [Acinetobacter baumannii 318814]MBD0443900.1 transglycosylase SLT domain-containing protein [Acinetobacter nosocomialis]MCT9284024.1 transglycosylase SLT domain-containing protein [Acinetobacter baumannii]MCU4554623.1 transglycosylase SLT domain-containing pr
MLQSKRLFYFLGCMVCVSGITNAKVPQMSSQQLGLYANQLNGSPRANIANSGTISNQSSNPKTVGSSSAVLHQRRAGNYTTVSYTNPPTQSPEVKQLEIVKQSQTSNTNWVQEYAFRASVTTPEVVQNYSYQKPNININYVRGREANLTCVIAAARSEGVPLYVLLGIQSKERGRNGEVNATNDMGHFQVNKQHFRNGGMFNPQDMERARTDGCYNAVLAAKILRDRLSTKVASVDFWTRAAAYHSWTPSVNARYRPDLIRYSMQWKQWLTQNGINPN